MTTSDNAALRGKERHSNNNMVVRDRSLIRLEREVWLRCFSTDENLDSGSRVPLPCALFFLPGLLLLWGHTPGVVTNFKSAKINWLQMELVQLTLLVLKNFLRLNATKTRHRILNQCQRPDNYWERGSTCVRGIKLTFPGKGNMYCGAEYSDASHFEDLFVLAI